MGRRGSYRSVQLRFASWLYVSRRWDAFERHTYICVYILKKKDAKPYGTTFHRPFKSKSTFQCSYFPLMWAPGKGRVTGIMAGEHSCVCACSWWAVADLMRAEEAVQGAVLEEEVGRGLFEALAKQDTSHHMGRLAYLTCLAGSVGMNDSFSMWGMGW